MRNSLWILIIITIHSQCYQIQGQDVGVLQKLAYVDVSSRLKTIMALNELYDSSNATLNNTFSKTYTYFDMLGRNFITKEFSISKISMETQNCIADVDKIYKNVPFIYNVSQIQTQHEYEKQYVYQKLLADIYQETRQKIDTFASEIVKFGIANDCETEPTCRALIEQKISSIEPEYEDIMEMAQVLFMQQENHYLERIQDYRIILEKAMKPYNLLADHCMQKHLRKDAEKYPVNN